MCLVEFGCLSICYLKDVTDVYSLLKNYQNPNAIRLTVTRSLEFCGILVTLFGRQLAFMVMLLVVKSNEDFLQEVKFQIFFFFYKMVKFIKYLKSMTKQEKHQTRSGTWKLDHVCVILKMKLAYFFNIRTVCRVQVVLRCHLNEEVNRQFEVFISQQRSYPK